MKTEAIVIKFVGDMNLGWFVNMLDDRIRSLKVLDKLKEWNESQTMKSNQGECNILCKKKTTKKEQPHGVPVVAQPKRI